MTSQPPKPKFDDNPRAFFEALADDPAWIRDRGRDEVLRLKYGLPPKPLPDQFQNYFEYSRAHSCWSDEFYHRTGMQQRVDFITAKMMQPKFDAWRARGANAKVGYPMINKIARELGFKWELCSWEELEAEHDRQVGLFLNDSN